VLVLVGVERVKYTVHTDVICAKSDFFRAACKEHWQEGQAIVVPLPDTEPDTFQKYMDYLCDRLGSEDSSLLPLIKFHVLGDFLGDVKARNQAMTLLFAPLHEDCPSTISVEFIWKHTAPGFLLRKWAVDMIAARLGPQHFAKCITRYPAEFVQDLAIKLQKYAYHRLDHPLTLHDLFTCSSVTIHFLTSHVYEPAHGYHLHLLTNTDCSYVNARSLFLAANTYNVLFSFPHTKSSSLHNPSEQHRLRTPPPSFQAMAGAITSTKRSRKDDDDDADHRPVKRQL
jgi:hypothetical protein